MEDLKQIIYDFLGCALLFICFIWLYFAMIAYTPEETPETPKDTKQIEITTQAKRRKQRTAYLKTNEVYYRVNMKG